jgi:hypothetical protein
MLGKLEKEIRKLQKQKDELALQIRKAAFYARMLQVGISQLETEG